LSVVFPLHHFRLDDDLYSNKVLLVASTLHTSLAKLEDMSGACWMRRTVAVSTGWLSWDCVDDALSHLVGFGSGRALFGNLTAGMQALLSLEL